MINFHTHTPSKDAVCSYYYPQKINTNFMFTYGIHPWFLDHNWTEFKANFLKLKNHQNFIALGEIGLDKNREYFSKQTEIFEKQIILAQKFNIKLIILHVVSSHNEVQQIIKRIKPNIKFVIHDFNGNIQIAKQYKKLAEVYFSLGPRLFKSTKLQELVKTMPDSIFFETDDQTTHDIESVYNFSKDLLKISEKELIKKVSVNFSNLLA